MVVSVQEIPKNDPLAVPEQKAIIDRILAENKNLPGAVMVVLNELQAQIGFVSPAMQAYVARQLRAPLQQVRGVISFYSFFTTMPRGKHTVKFCMGTACYVGGMPQLIEKAKQVLNCDIGKTTADGMATLEVCRCVGACSQAPVIVIDEELHGRVRPNKLPQILKKAQQ
ncbi:MAG: NAD(P)H-dependent oxidoreductase subunit E [Anaerolineae bacterium]|nr:NAD(P)H-dependent oxidoreductase subunit E [Thermoflexales bacterium]MDW8406466.1 NAD(P)H-dependent oxidoreductase subunit E [Anaerolineae bacterium]